MTVYAVYLRRTMSQEQTATVEVEAATPDEARVVALGMADSDIEWQAGDEWLVDRATTGAEALE